MEMAVSNEERNCNCGANHANGAERRIRGESGHPVGSHLHQNGHARTHQRSRIPLTSTTCTRQQHHQQQQQQQQLHLQQQKDAQEQMVHQDLNPLRPHQEQQQTKHHHTCPLNIPTQNLTPILIFQPQSPIITTPTTTPQTTTTTTTIIPNLISNKKITLGTHSCKVVKKYRSSRIRRVKRQEYKKLREMVPALQEKNKVSKVVVIEEAIKYIDELHSALVQRFKAREIPSTFNGVHLDPREIHGGNIRDLIRRLLANANPNSLPPARIENVRTLPSFLQKLARHKKS